MKGLIEYAGRSLFIPSAIALDRQVEIIENLDGLKALQPEWDRLAPGKKVEPWQSFNWMEAAAFSYSQEHLLRIITVRDHGRLTAVAPMVLKRSEQPLKPMQLHILGAEELKEPNRLIASDAASLEILLGVLTSEPVYPIRLSRIPNEHGMLELILNRFKKAGWITRIMHMPYPYLELEGLAFKKSLKNDLKRSRKKADVFGSIGFENVDSAHDKNLSSRLEAAFKIENSGWKGQNYTSILSNQARKSFFERYARSSQQNGTLRLPFLTINDQPVAAQYAIESEQAYWLLNVGYDEKYRLCSPGNLLLERTIKDAANRNLVRYNLLGKEEEWTRRWTRSARDCFVLEAFRYNWSGLRAMVSDAMYMAQLRRRKRLKSVHQKRRNIKGAEKI
jgi:CelD/BcsL family acetyltransferase involved in cellulose biosynthesis